MKLRESFITNSSSANFILMTRQSLNKSLDRLFGSNDTKISNMIIEYVKKHLSREFKPYKYGKGYDVYIDEFFDRYDVLKQYKGSDMDMYIAELYDDEPINACLNMAIRDFLISGDDMDIDEDDFKFWARGA